MAEFQCRMYENKFPEVEDLVMVQVKSIAEMGAYVSLLEYNNIEGMILLSELSRRRIRSISKLIRIGRQEVVVVLRVDKEKGYIDLSKRRVSPEDIQKCEEKFNKAKTVHSIMTHVSNSLHRPLEDLYKQFGWPLYQSHGHAYDAFKLAIQDPEKVFATFKLDPDTLDSIMKNIRRRLTPQPVKIRADFELTCFDYEGIDAIKAALFAGQAKSTEEIPIKIKLVAPPLYVMVTTSLDKERGIALLQEAIEEVSKVIKEKKGSINVTVAPRAISEREERELSKFMDDLARRNAETSGDDDESDSDIDIEVEPGQRKTEKPKSGDDDESGSESGSDDDDEEEAGDKKEKEGEEKEKKADA